MKYYAVEFEAVLHQTIYIEAESREEARELAAVQLRHSLPYSHSFTRAARIIKVSKGIEINRRRVTYV